MASCLLPGNRSSYLYDLYSMYDPSWNRVRTQVQPQTNEKPTPSIVLGGLSAVLAWTELYIVEELI